MMIRMVFPVLILALALDAPGLESAQGTSDQEVRTMKIRMDVEGTAITATLVDNATSRDFVSLLPLTLTLEDYAATEKISDLPRRLSTEVHRQAAILRSETLPTILLGGIWPSSTGISVIRRDSSN
jgi:hypothetical protein